MSENDKIDPESKEDDSNEEGNSKVGAPDEGNAGKETEKGEEVKGKSDDLEEMTYKERYSKSQKEVQEKLLPQLKAAKKRLGLSDDDIITEEEKEESEAEEEDDANNDAEEEKGSSDYEHYKMVSPGEETAMDIVWDSFASKHPEVETNPKLKESLILEFARFKTDALGNRVPLKKALEDTYLWVNRDNYLKKVAEDAKNEGIIEATKNKEGEIKSSSSKEVKHSSTPQLTEKEKLVAKSMGVSEEEYIKNKVVYEDDDE